MVRFFIRNKRIAAALLLAVFFFISAEKVLHSHQFTPVFSKTNILKNSSGCSICDFQLGKDAQLAAAVIIPAQFPLIQNLKGGYNCQLLFLRIDNIFGRGPPCF
jgi:hypothetical protein